MRENGEMDVTSYSFHSFSLRVHLRITYFGGTENFLLKVCRKKLKAKGNETHFRSKNKLKSKIS